MNICALLGSIFLTSFILSKTILKGYSGFFVLELPDYKKVKIRSVIKTCKKLNASKEFIVAQVQEMYACNIEEAEKLVESYWND